MEKLKEENTNSLCSVVFFCFASRFEKFFLFALFSRLISYLYDGVPGTLYRVRYDAQI